MTSYYTSEYGFVLHKYGTLWVGDGLLEVYGIKGKVSQGFIESERMVLHLVHLEGTRHNSSVIQRRVALLGNATPLGNLKKLTNINETF